MHKNPNHNPTDTFLSRRRMLASSAAGAMTCSAVSLQAGSEGPGTKRSAMGLVIYTCNHLRQWLQSQSKDKDLFAPHAFLEHCQSVGAGGMQAKLGVLPAAEVDRLRKYAERYGLFIDAVVMLPEDNDDIERFVQEIRTAREVGVQAARTTMIPGRRYERFRTLEEFRQFERRGEQMLERALPVVEKYEVPLAVENHKDQRLDERIALLQRMDSEFIGACLDTGNSLALLDGAYETMTALAPHAFTVHLKDQALKEYQDGFLLADVPLGTGSLDLKRIVSMIKQSKPDVQFSLELITRDPLEVPCLTSSFWTTMPSVPAADLARTLRFVREYQAEGQQVSGLTPLEKMQLEQENIRSSLEYAARVLGL